MAWRRLAVCRDVHPTSGTELGSSNLSGDKSSRGTGNNPRLARPLIERLQRLYEVRPRLSGMLPFIQDTQDESVRRPMSPDYFFSRRESQIRNMAPMIATTMVPIRPPA
jgi:hypothetical protein